MPRRTSGTSKESKRSRRSSDSASSSAPPSPCHVFPSHGNIIHQYAHGISNLPGHHPLPSNTRGYTQAPPAYDAPLAQYGSGAHGSNSLYQYYPATSSGINGIAGSTSLPNLYSTDRNAAFVSRTFTPDRTPSYQYHSPRSLQSNHSSQHGYFTKTAIGDPASRSTPTYCTSSAPSIPATSPNYNAGLAAYYTNHHGLGASKASPSGSSFMASQYPTPPSMSAATSTPCNIYNYLAAPDCTVDSSLISYEPRKLHLSHSWFDTRNVTSWNTFSMSTLMAIPELTQALNSSASLVFPYPPDPSTCFGRDLLEKCVGKVCVKVNQVLRAVQGQPHMTIMTLSDASSRKFLPDFTAGYQDDDEKTIENDTRRRVVGVLRGSHLWHTRMRNGKEHDQKRYLAGLADVHQAMRLHGTRYGYIISEVELVCVRYRASKDSRKVPVYGALELSASIPMLSTRPMTSPGRWEMTPAVALFYLHMLAQNRALPGHHHWKLEIGAPKDGTRKVHKERDAWMPGILKSEERKMMTARKWVHPNDKVSRFERKLGESSKSSSKRRKRS
ncbi:hypothetical protein ANO11243_060490 [Dothideomycetidae sp. 11243]|nr:hypothetical protein ANO11243_060490 [fungal sp. No.11243]